jgi:putative membrane protein
MQAPLRKTALSVALLSVGLAMSAMAQNPGSQGTTTGGTSGTSAGATSGSTSGASTSGATSRGATSRSAGASSASDSKLAHGDRKFIEDAARGGMAEVQLGQLAAQKAQSSEVKQFGQKMVDDHSKANDQLKSIASSKSVTLPTDLDSSHKRDYDRLSKLSGAEFDREYMKHMVSDHKKDVSDFRKEAKSGKDTEVKNFASTTLPTLEQHLQMAQQADATVRSASRGSNTARTSSGASSGMSSGTSGSTSGTSGSTSGTSGSTSGTSGSTSGTSGSTTGSTTHTTPGTSGASGTRSGASSGTTSSSAPATSGSSSGTSGTAGK